MKKLIEQIGRERLEQYAFDKRMCNINEEIRLMARALLAVLDAKPNYYIHRVEVCDSYGPEVDLRAFVSELDASKCKDDHGGEVIEVFTTPPAASEPVSKGYTWPDGMVIMPRKLTAENGAKHALSGEFFVETREECHECGGRGCEDCEEEGSLEVRLAIDWTTIKEIYSKTVEHFEAAPALGGVDG